MHYVVIAHGARGTKVGGGVSRYLIMMEPVFRAIRWQQYQFSNRMALLGCRKGVVSLW